MGEISNPFEKLLISRPILRRLINLKTPIATSVKEFRKIAVKVMHSDVTNREDRAFSEMNAAITEIEKMPDSDAKKLAQEYVLGGSEDELFGPKLELQKAQEQIKLLEEKVDRLQGTIESGTDRLSRREAAVDLGLGKLLEALTRTEAPEDFKTVSQLRGYFFFGEVCKHGRSTKELPYPERKKRKQSNVETVEELSLSIARIRRDGVMETTTLEAGLRTKGIETSKARETLKKKLAQAIANPETLPWQSRGLLIGICHFKCEFPDFSETPALIPRGVVAPYELAIFASGRYFLTAQNIGRTSSDKEEDYLIALQRVGNKFLLSDFKVPTKTTLKPVAP